SIFVDSFFIFYAILVVQRIILYRYIFEMKDVAFSWANIGLIAGISLLTGTLWSLSKTSIGSKLFSISKNSPVTRYTVEIFGWFLFNITFIAGWVITKMSIIDLLSADGLNGAGRIFSAMFKPEFGIFDDALFAIIETIYIALLATVLSIPVTLLLSFLTARNLMKDSTLGLIVYTVLRFILNFIRSIEPLIWAIVFSVWVGIGPFAGMIALLVHTIASNAKLYSEAIEGIEIGPIEAIRATGANKIQVIWFAVVPQIVLPFLSFTIYRWDINVRMATIIGLVGGGGIGTMLMQYQGLAKWNEVGLIVIMVALVVWIMDFISAKIREAIY
ncbi:MAG: phosphonate ABC transporter, permease protein PhnE, partial [Ignavibacteriales bacterium]|nr:phosphonate ABC transporter, permease protein PhnE [Ignavibacteriales bacterium]